MELCDLQSSGLNYGDVTAPVSPLFLGSIAPSRTPCPPGWLPAHRLCEMALRQDRRPRWVWRWAPEKCPLAAVVGRLSFLGPSGLSA